MGFRGFEYWGLGYNATRTNNEGGVLGLYPPAGGPKISNLCVLYAQITLILYIQFTITEGAKRQTVNIMHIIVSSLKLYLYYIHYLRKVDGCQYILGARDHCLARRRSLIRLIFVKRAS